MAEAPNNIPAPVSVFLDFLLNRVADPAQQQHAPPPPPPAASPPSSFLDSLLHRLAGGHQNQRPQQPPGHSSIQINTDRHTIPPSSSMPMPHLLQHQEARNDGEPRMDVMCSPNEYKFAIDLPGVSADTLDVRVQNRTICVSGSRPALVVQPPSLVCMSERPAPSRFRRNILVHADADMSHGVDAHFRDGLLCLSIPRNSSVGAHRRANTRIWNSSNGHAPLRNYAPSSS